MKNGESELKAGSPDDEIMQETRYESIIYEHNRKSCRNCTGEIVQEFVKGIWKHDDYNRYDCTEANPITRKQEKKYNNTWEGNCKLHNYQPSDFSEAMICTECFANVAKKVFFTNRNVYWCRIHNTKFTNIEYHKKKYHTIVLHGITSNVVMDYVEYVADQFEEEIIDTENDKRRWDKHGHGCNVDIRMDKKQYGFRVINYGFISQSKFIQLICKIDVDSSIGWLKDRKYAAGNDIKFISEQDKDYLLFIDDEKYDVALKFNTLGKLVWINPKFGKKFKEDVREKFKHCL